MKPAEKKGGLPPTSPDSPLRVPSVYVVTALFAVSCVFFLTWWASFPIIPELFKSYWERDRRFLSLGPHFWSTWGGNIALMAVLAAFQAAGWAAGRRVIAWVAGRTVPGLWGVAFAAALGNGLFGILLLGIGLCGLLWPGVVWFALLLALTLGARAWEWRAWVEAAREFRAGGEEPEPRPGGGAGHPAAALVSRAVAAGGAALSLAALAGLWLTYSHYLNRGLTAGAQAFRFAVLLGAAVAAFNGLRWLAGEAVRAWVRWSLVAFVAFITVYNWLPALEPPWFYDSLVYHLAVPEQYLLAHKVHYLDHTFFSNFPFLQEMRFMFLMITANDVAAKLLHWADGVWCAVAVFALTRPWLGRTAGWLAAAVVLSQPTVRFLQHVTMVELGLTWFELTGVMAMAAGLGWGPRALTQRRIPRTAWFVLAGWFLGYAQGIKYIGLFTSVLVLGALAVEELRSGRAVAGVGRAFAAVVGCASVWTGVWLAKNFLMTGNPFFPLMHEVFPTLNWDSGLYDRWMYDNTKYGTGHDTLVNWLRMPSMASIDVSAFGTFTLNPFPLLFLPLLLVFRRLPPLFAFMGGYAMLYFVMWASSSQQTRFLFPMMAPAGVAVAYVVARLGSGSRILKGLLGTAAGWILVVSAFGEVHNRHSNIVLASYTFGHLDRKGLLRIGVSYYQTMERVNEAVPKGGRVLFVGADESYYCRHPRLCNSIYDRSTLGEWAREADSPEALLRRLRQRRITHMLVHEPRCEEYVNYGMFDWGERAKANFLDLWNTYGRLEYVSKGAFLFAIADEPLPPAERKRGRPSYFHDPDNVAAARDLVKKLDRLFQQKRAREALAMCEELVRLVPGAPHAYSYRGYAYGLLNKPEKAIADYERAVAFGFPTAVVYYNLGGLYEQQRKYERALSRYLKAMEVDPSMGNARERVIEVATFLKRYDVALKAAEERLRADPGNSTLREQVERFRRLAGSSGRN